MAAGEFPDHFSPMAAQYARFRPSYPAPLLDWLAAIAPSRAVVWDAGCGSGQATRALADRFEQVIATDPSAEQIHNAPVNGRISWRVATAEEGIGGDTRVDLITVAQALHWFNQADFFATARRTLKPDGVIAVWSYGEPHVDDAPLSDLLHHFHEAVVGPYWPIERGHVDRGYEGMEFPFARIPPPPFDMHADWSLDQLLGYVGSWSATRRYREARNSDPVPALRAEMGPRWGSGTRVVRWPLTVVAGKCQVTSISY